MRSTWLFASIRPVPNHMSWTQNFTQQSFVNCFKIWSRLIALPKLKITIGQKLTKHISAYLNNVYKISKRSWVVTIQTRFMRRSAQVWKCASSRHVDHKNLDVYCGAQTYKDVLLIRTNWFPEWRLCWWR